MNCYESEDGLIPPLGGRGLLPRMAAPGERDALLRQAADLPRVELSGRAYGDLVMLGIGGFTPLRGFMSKEDWRSVCENITLADGTFWPMPIVLDVREEEIQPEGTTVALTHGGRVAGTMLVEEVWTLDDDETWFECETIFKGKGKDSENFATRGPERHSGVRAVLDRRRQYLAGSVTVLRDDYVDPAYRHFMLTPADLRAKAKAEGWKEITAMQLRNPPHRSHEYLVRIGLETADAVLIHAPMGALKAGDLPLDIRLQCIQTLIDNYLPADRTVLAGYPLDMRYAGPREALFHAIFRQNYGVTRQIVGRDHAGVGDFYLPFESQEIFARLPRHRDPVKNLLTRPLTIRWPFYCRKCDGMASLNTCPHSMEDRVFYSGSLLRKSFSEGTIPPEGFIRREVFDILARHYREMPLNEKVQLYGAADGTSLNKGIGVL